jgi:hypothetical protein
VQIFHSRCDDQPAERLTTTTWHVADGAVTAEA